MPFDGFPVFLLSPRGERLNDRRSSRRLPRPFRAFAHSVPAVHCPRQGPARTGSTLTLLGSPPEHLVLFSACSRKVPQGRVCQVPPEPAHSVCTLSANRAAKGHPLDLPGLFRPGNAPELPPSGPLASRRSKPVSGLLPPVSFHVGLSRRSRLRRVTPSAKLVRTRKHAPLPSWRSPL